MSEDRLLAEMFRRICDLEKRVRILEGREERKEEATTRAAMIVHEMARKAAADFKVKVDGIYGGSKMRAYVLARQWVMYEASRRKLSLTEVGDALGRDHTTIWHGIRAEAKRRKALPDMEDSAKIEAGRNAASTASCPNRNRDLDGGAQHG